VPDTPAEIAVLIDDQATTRESAPCSQSTWPMCSSGGVTNCCRVLAANTDVIRQLGFAVASRTEKNHPTDGRILNV
jgi:hypothetical protein